MPIVPIAFSVSTAQDLEDALNVLLAPLLTDRLLAVQMEQIQNVPSFKANLSVALTYETGAPAILSPFQFKQFSAATEAIARILVANFIAANPGYFISPIMAIFRPQTPDPNLGVVLGVFYSQDPAASANWGFPTTGGGPGGPAGGDLFGVYPNPQVGGFRNIPLDAAIPATGQYWIYNALSGQYELSQLYRYFVDSAAAVAAAPFINGTFVVLSPGNPTSEAGTYQVTSNGGAAFPADYTLVDDSANTAADISIVDVGNYYPSPKNVEVALQAVGAGIINGPTGVLAVGITVMDAVAITACEGGDWEVLIENGVLRYKATLSLAHDNAVVHVSEVDAAPGPGVGVLPVTFDADILAGNLRLLATSVSPGWSYKLRRLALLTV